jgi:pyruvate kinase
MDMTFKRSKILVTIGPATNNYEAIEKLVVSGVNGFRLNFSHGSNPERDQQIAWIRQASIAVGKPVAVLQDLQGPKIRLGELTQNMVVSAADELCLSYGVAHEGMTIPVQYDLSQKVQLGERLYIFDGKIRTEVISVDPANASVTVHVLNGGTLMSRKGINLPDTNFGGDILTEKDRQDIEYGADKDIDYVALSFVQTADDITDLRSILEAKGSTAKVVAKIETKAAIEPEALEAIVRVSDAVMVARGDLAVEAGAENVPIVQRDIISLCQQYGKISIVATQMMASMVDNPEPTRAEVSDIANAVITGADCLMLSDETANGSYPIEAVVTMKRVIMRTQERVPVRPLYFRSERADKEDAISSAAVTLAQQLQATAIVAETRSGATAFSIASHRPSLPIISVSSSARVAQQLALLYANKSFHRPDGERAGLELAKELRENKFFAPGTTIVLVSGQQPGLVGATDTIRVRTLD